MERETGCPRNDPQHCRVLHIELDDLWILLSRRTNQLEVSTGLPIRFHFHPLGHGTVASRVAQVGPRPLLLCHTHTSRWLIAHEHEDEAFDILADLEGKDSNDSFILTQHKEIVYAVQYEKQNAIPWSKLLIGKTGSQVGTKTIRRIILGAGTQAMQQVCHPRTLCPAASLTDSLACWY